MTALRFGLFGTGFWARDNNGAAIAAYPDAELVGVWGRDVEKARSVAGHLGANAFADIDALIDAVDVVAIVLPADVQAEIAVRAANAGRHVLLEKPMAFTTEAADRIVEAVERNGVRGLVFHTARFTPEVEAWVRGVRATDDWHGGSVALLASIFHPGNPFGESAWRREKGALWDVGPHALDMIVSTLGPVEHVVARAGRGDTVHLVLNHASQASSALTVSLTVPETATTTACWVYGPRGIATMPAATTSPVEAYGRAITALLAEEPGGRPGHPSDVRHGREIVRVLDAAQESLDGVRAAARGR